jgi:uncharacterized repeat protein (TIGR01451 family)
LQPLDPTFEYVHPACGEVRNLGGTIDIGAYEFGGAGASLCSSPSADFSLAINPSSLNLNAGATGTYTVTVSPVNGFNGVVTLSAAGLPTGATATFSPPSLTLSTGALTSTLSLSTLSSLASTSYSFTATATSGAISHTTTAGFSITTPPVGTPFLTGFALNAPPLRNNYGNFVGMKFTVGSSALTVNSLGRICVAGNSGTHTIKLVNAANGMDVVGGSLSLSMAGCTAGQFKYAALPSSITLSANTAYYVVTLEVIGGDRWYDTGGVSSTGAASVNSSIYFNGTTWVPWSGPNTSYVPANFLYTVASAPPDMTITKTHAGNFRQGQTGATYTITATNSGSSATRATVSVIDTLPSGLTATGISGTNWTCTQPAGPCSRSDVLAGGTSYPPLTLTVNVAANASASVTNTATVSGGGETNTGNDTVNDLTAIDPAAGGTAFLTGFALNGPPLRNNYGNFVGMKFTVGSSALTVSSLGRICVAGNSGTHTIKLVNASTGTDVAGGSLSLSMAGCTAGQFKYAALPSPITLPANAAYYLVTLEVNGGDRWYDTGSVSSTSAAAVNNSVYFNGTTWVVWSAPNTSYVPANFLYQ